MTYYSSSSWECTYVNFLPSDVDIFLQLIWVHALPYTLLKKKIVVGEEVGGGSCFYSSNQVLTSRCCHNMSKTYVKPMRLILIGLSVFVCGLGQQVDAFSVGGTFSSSSTTTRTTAATASNLQPLITSATRIQQGAKIRGHLPFPSSEQKMALLKHHKTTCWMKNKEEEEDDDNNSSTSMMKPGTLLILPFVALLGIDIVINIIFLTKRTYEYFVLGQAPSSETWW